MLIRVNCLACYLVFEAHACVFQEAFNGQEMGSMEELRNTAPIPKPVLQVHIPSNMAAYQL